MNILVALDSFKGSLSSKQANETVKEGLLAGNPALKVTTVPVADGGEGTVEAMTEATGGTFHHLTVTGPLGEKVRGKYGILGDGKTAVIEVAEACGLTLVPEEKRNPLHTTSRGVGELILDAAEKGCTEIIIGLGGSATNDAGTGMLQALGYRFYDENGLITESGGKILSSITRMDDRNVPETLKNVCFYAACDVNNPLYGENGAAYVFAPQKGATEDDVVLLDQGLRNFARVVSKEQGIDLQNIPGAGAAGGLGAAFAGILQAELVPGVELVLKKINLPERIRHVDLVITGEGRLDHQTAFGKTPAGIAQTAKKFNIPVIAIAGDVAKAGDSLHDHGIDAYFSIVTGPQTVSEAMEPSTARKNLKTTAEQLSRLILSMKQYS